MHLSKVVGLGLVLGLLAGCGSSGSTDDNKKDDGTQESPLLNNDNNKSDDNLTSNIENNNSQTIVAGFKASTGILIETKSNGNKIAWVNSSGTECLVLNVKDSGQTVVEGATDHCEKLSTESYAGYMNWRVPTVDESTNIMLKVATSGANKIIYPAEVPGCKVMATSENDTFVYTTNSRTKGKSFTSDRTLGGVRCVADLP